MTQDAAFDDAPDPRLPARLSTGVGAVLGIAVALLLAMLPGGAVYGSRLHSAISTASADQSIIAAANRVGAARAAFNTARGPNARPNFGDTPMLLASALAVALLVLGAASTRPPLARAQAPARRPATVRARAPPRA